MKKTRVAFIIAIITIVGLLFGLVVAVGESAPQSLDTEVKTLSDLGNATIAGTGAYYDDGMLKYANSGNTIGYNYDQSNSLLEFDIIFDYIRFPGWFSMTFKANGFDRTQSPNLTQKGYSIVVYASGAVEVWKPNLSTPITGSISGFSEGIKYRFKLGAYNDAGNVKIYFSVNDTEILNATDSQDPYLTGNWFNICGDGGTSARLFSTKKEIIPNYYTYTLSTLGDYPNCTDVGAQYDKYKNITLNSGTIGWTQGLKNYSVECNMNWSNFGAGSNVWVAMRASGFDRANSPNLEQKGYVFRIGQVGAIEIYKSGNLVTSGSWGYEQDTNYVFEFGCVDLNSQQTMVFVNINGTPVASMIDSEQPISNAGAFNINGDGVLTCKITSVSTKLTPLVSKVIQGQERIDVETYFNNTVSYTEMNHSDFSDVMLDAILVNGISVKDFNNAYYAREGAEKTLAIRVKYVNNKLVVSINKNLYQKTNDTQTNFNFEELTIKKTGAGTGLICPSGYVLKQTYYYS